MNIYIYNIRIPKPSTALLHLNLARLDVYSYASAFNAVRGQDTAAASSSTQVAPSACMEKVQSPSQSKARHCSTRCTMLHPTCNAGPSFPFSYKFDSSFLAWSCTDCTDFLWSIKYAKVWPSKLLTLFDSSAGALCSYYIFAFLCNHQLIAH